MCQLCARFKRTDLPQGQPVAANTSSAAELSPRYATSKLCPVTDPQARLSSRWPATRVISPQFSSIISVFVAALGMLRKSVI
jgi:hypothetical protein